MSISVRFLASFIITIVQTTIDDETGQLVVSQAQKPVKVGDIYTVEQYQRHQDGKLDLHFPDTSPLAGVANRIEPDYCELVVPQAIAKKKASGGCGSCGKNKKQ